MSARMRARVSLSWGSGLDSYRCSACDLERSPSMLALGCTSTLHSGLCVGDGRADACLCPSRQGQMVQVPGTQHEQNMSVAGLSVSSELSASFLLLCALM